MSLLPMLFSHWWEDLDRPHRIFDQHFGQPVDPEDILDPYSNSSLLVYRPTRHNSRRRFHPFLTLAKRGNRGTSTVEKDKDKFQVTLDVQQFAPEEINVKVVDNYVVVDAKHEEKEDEHGFISRQFSRKYMIPSQCDIDRVESKLSSDGLLTIIAPKKQALLENPNERPISIQFTGQPAITSSDKNESNGVDSKEQHKQQQQSQRAKRGVKA